MLSYEEGSNHVDDEERAYNELFIAINGVYPDRFKGIEFEDFKELMDNLFGENNGTF